MREISFSVDNEIGSQKLWINLLRVPHNALLYLNSDAILLSWPTNLLCAVFFSKTELISWQYLFEIILDLGKDILFIYFWYVRKNAYWFVVRFCVFWIFFVYWSYFGIFKIWWKYLQLLRLRKKKYANTSLLFLTTLVGLSVYNFIRLYFYPFVVQVDSAAANLKRNRKKYETKNLS